MYKRQSILKKTGNLNRVLLFFYKFVIPHKKDNNMKTILNCKTLILGILLGFICQSCSTVDKEQVKETILDFFSAYHNEDGLKVMEIFPNCVNLEHGFTLKFTSVDVELKDILVVNDSNIIATVTHHWVNPYGTDNPTKMKFYLKKNDEKYEILDTKNFISYKNDKLYNFARNTGAIISYLDTTDICISKKISGVEKFYNRTKERIKTSINWNLQVGKGWRWEVLDYSDYAIGRATVTNNTKFPIPEPKYKITYCKSDDKTIVTTDEGTITYGVLAPGQSVSFSWSTPYVGNASRAKVDVVCDEECIEEIISNLPYDGSEFWSYKLGNEDLIPWLQ